MSATMTMTYPASLSTANTNSPSTCCPSCGTSLSDNSDTHSALLEAQRQIEDLQAQVRLLNQKATAAVDRWADYEDEITRLRAASTTSNSSNTTNLYTPAPSIPASSPRSSFLNAGANRISQLLSPPKSVPNLATNQASRASLFSSPSLNTDDLLEALGREQSLRIAAETRFSDTSREVEELSVSLFEQANEMVATERRARAKLEERVQELEKRDEQKRQRLSRLEGAMGRIERVNVLLGK